jgi:tetratricopeptide (TPR) repeat protein
VSKASQLRQKAQAFLKKGKVSEAVEAYKKLLQFESRNPNLYNELGDIYLRADDKLQAVSSFEMAVENYEKVALYNNAVAVCKKILRVVPNRLESIFKLGELKAKQKFAGEASRMFFKYLEMVSADEGGAGAEALNKKAAMMLELVPEDNELHARAADALIEAGMKIAAAEIYARLIVRTTGSGDSETAASFKVRLEPLLGSLSAVEKAGIDEILAGSLDMGEDGSVEPDLTVEEIDPEAAAVEVGSEPVGEPAAEEVIAEEPAAEAQVEEPAPELEKAPGEAVVEEAPQAEYEIPAEPAPQPEPEAEPAAEYEIPAEPLTGQEADPEPAAEAEAAKEYATPAEPVQEYEIPAEPAAADNAGVTVSDDDLSDILEAEDAANEGGEVNTEKLAEEITSDVEEDDFRSHYDLGMAYIEMALYNEAIKELQISARSEQLQLRSLEMIGHCFLLLENPRLAVKQLNRGLELAQNTGGDNLGIHYNLGLAYEALDEPERAREHFEEVYIVDVTFRDISEKMKKYSTVS